MPASNKRERELARAKYERQQAKRTEQAAKRRKRYQVATAVVVAVVVVVGFAILAKVVKGDGTSTDAGASPQPTASDTTNPTDSATPAPTPAAVIPTDGSPAKCTYTASGKATRPVALPPTSAPTKPATETATISLGGKLVTVKLLASKAPCTVNSFVHLAKAKFYDSTPCHRLTAGTLNVLQCGDPNGTGSGGPGYNFADENLAGATYPAGTVAMANNGQASSNGSQFFLVYTDSTLGPNYTPFGTIVGGLDVLKAIGAAGIKGGGGDGAPATPVTVTSVTVGG